MARLAWNVKNAISVLISPGIGVVEASGETNVYPAVPTIYTLLATKANGSQVRTEIQVLPTPLTANPTSYSGSVHVGVNSSIAISNLTNGPFTGAGVAAGALPPGISVSLSGTQVILSGTPTTAGNYSAAVRVIGPAGFADISVAMTVLAQSAPVGSPVGVTPVGSAPVGSPVGSPVGTPAVSVTPTFAILNLLRDQAFSQGMAIINNGPAVSVTAIQGQPTPGMTMAVINNGFQLRYSGVPTVDGVRGVTYQVNGSNGTSATFSLNVAVFSGSTPVGSETGGK